jgi:hypothetical protein
MVMIQECYFTLSEGMQDKIAKPNILNSVISLASDGCSVIRLMELFIRTSNFFSLKGNTYVGLRSFTCDIYLVFL